MDNLVPKTLNWVVTIHGHISKTHQFFSWLMRADLAWVLDTAQTDLQLGLLQTSNWSLRVCFCLCPPPPFQSFPSPGEKEIYLISLRTFKGFSIFLREKGKVDAVAPKPNITCVPSHPDCSLILLPVIYLCSHTAVGLTSLLISPCSPGWCGFYYVDQAGFEPSASASQGLGVLSLFSWFACKPLEPQRYYVSTYWYSAWQRTSVLSAAL